MSKPKSKKPADRIYADILPKAEPSTCFLSSTLSALGGIILGSILMLGITIPDQPNKTNAYKLGVADACLNVFENRQGKKLEELDYKTLYDQTIEWRKNEKPVIVPGL